MKKIPILIFIMLHCALMGTLWGQSETHKYSFMEDRSHLVKAGGIAGSKVTFTVSGTFNLVINRMDNTAVFEQVEIVLSSSDISVTPDLNDIFLLSDLVGQVIDENTVEFGGENPGGVPVKLIIKLANGLAHLQGSVIPECCDKFAYFLDAYAVTSNTDWLWNYQDDFSSNKAKNDSYDHSVFWPYGAFPPPEPYLFYTPQVQPIPGPDLVEEPLAIPPVNFDMEGGYPVIKPDRKLVFVGYAGVPAHLSYVFPLNIEPVIRPVKGIIELDVKFPLDMDGLDLACPQGYLLYSVSDDGQSWSSPESLPGGHATIMVSSPKGSVYVTFLGSKAVIDNLEVHLLAPNATIRVPEDYATIQEAIDAAVDGDIISVGPGTYTGDGNWDLELRSKAIVVRGRAGPEKTIIDLGCVDSGEGAGDEMHRGFYIHENEGPRTVIQGFTIANGYVPGDSIPDDDMRWNLSPKHPIGGGIYCEFTRPTIVNCIVDNCWALVGGGIGCVGGGPRIIKTVVTGCGSLGVSSSQYGLGRGMGIAIIRQGDTSIIDSRIAENMATVKGLGGGIYIHRSTAKILNCTILRNAIEGYTMLGGGIYCGYAARAEIRNCVIAGNEAAEGGGIFSQNGIIVAGEKSSSDGDGENGGQGDGQGDIIPLRNYVRVKNCTIAHNKIVSLLLKPLTDEAGGIFAKDSDIIVKDSIVWYNTGKQITIKRAASKSPVIYTDVQYGYLGQGNIDAKPLFASALPETADYHLQSLFGRYYNGQWVIDNKHSPCIDTGDPKEPYYLEPLPNGKRINMGAYGNTCQASKGKGYLVYHVDAINGDDSNNGLSRLRAFRAIQRGIDAARDFDRILVWPGIYREAINLKGKAITLQSAADAAVIQAPDSDGIGVSFHSGEGPDTVLKNFVITGCRVMGIFCNFGSPTIDHVTVVANGFGLEARNNSHPKITNSIFWKNANGDLFKASADYSCIQHPNGGGQGNISRYPWFADPLNGDYHLRSQRGRFVPYPPLELDAGQIYAPEGQWVLDNVTSPCIDAGDPTIAPRAERMPNGGRINMGAYGGTSYASLSEWALQGDFNLDGKVNFDDFAVFAANWLASTMWAK